MFAVTSLYQQVTQGVGWRDIALYAVVLYITWQIYRDIRQMLLSPLMKIPGLPYRPVLGNMLEVRRAEPMTNAIRWIDKYKSKLVRFWYYGGQLKLVTGDPEIFRRVLVNNSRNYVRDSFVLGEAFIEFAKYPPLFMLSGVEHHMIRRICNPAFRVQALIYMSEVFSKKYVAVVEKWRELLKQGDEIVPVERTLGHMTMEVILNVAFDCDIDVINNPETSGLGQIQRIMNKLTKAGSIISRFIPFFKYFPTKDKNQFEEDLVFVWKMIEDIQAKKKQSGYQINKKWQDILTNLMCARDTDGQSALTDKQLFGQVVGFLLAGMGTTSAGMTWTLLYLAQDVERQQKVRQEVQSVLSSDHSTITVDDIEKMPYLTLCINESLRICPPVAAMSRKSIHDDTLLDYHIPAGTSITLHIASLHWANWDEPDKFLPERFMNIPEAEIRRKFLPFSYGPYMCIGHQFAMIQMKIVLARILKEFELSWVPHYTYKRKRGLTIRPDPPLVLKLRKIQK